MRAKFSPTISERYIDRLWWVRNGGGYGLLEDDSQMSDTYHQFDHEGFDSFGYDRWGRDRAGNSIRDYESSEALFSDMVEARDVYKYVKPVSEYWHAVTMVASQMADRYPGLMIVDPQAERPDHPHIALHVVKGGGYGVKLTLENVDGAPRSIDVRFDDGTGGSSRKDHAWSVNVITQSGGEITQAALCLVDSMEVVLDFAFEAVSSFDPDRLLFEVRIEEGGNGTVFLSANSKGECSSGDVLGNIYAASPSSALEAFALRFEEGGVVRRMAARGLCRIAAEQHNVTDLNNVFNYNLQAAATSPMSPK